MRLGAYETQDEVGRGGMGVVYRARSADPAAPTFAIKVLTSAAPNALERFERERRLLSALTQAEGFVPLLDAGTAFGRPFLVMPFVSGGTLEKKLEHGPLDVASAITIVREVAGALRLAHERGIVHRDLKPSNILFDGSGRPLIADLGLAKHFRKDVAGASQSRSLSEQGTSAGTPGYMAPEQIDDARAVGPQADVFALGAVLFQCVTGRLPFAAPSLLGYAKALRGKAPPLRTLLRGAPAWLERVVARALASDPAERFADGGALAQALEEPAPGRSRVLAVVALAAALSATALVIAVRSSPGPRPPVSPVKVVPPKPVPPKVSPREASTRAAELVHSGAEKAKAGDSAGAIADFTLAIELDPANIQPWIDRGVLRGRMGDTEGEIADLDRLLERAPKEPIAWAHRGMARAQKGDYEGGLADLTHGLELDPSNARHWYDRGVLKTAMGDTEGAIADYTRAIELDPGKGSALVNRADLRGKKGDHAGEIEDLDRAIEVEPTLSTAWFNRAIGRQERGDLPGATADLERWLELEPDDPRAPAIRATIAKLRR